MEENLPSSLSSLLLELDRNHIKGYQRYSQVKKYLSFKAREKGVPVAGTFELTPLCNLSCKMCYVHLEKEQMQDRELLPVESWKTLMEQAVNEGLMFASITGGECLTYPGFRELYTFLKSKGVEITVLTNGVLLTEEIVAFFKSNPPASVQITLYGVDEEEYERITGKRVFGKVLEGINRLRAADIPVFLSVTPNQYMEKGIELIRFIHDQGLDYLINAGLKAPREETGRSLHDASIDTYFELILERIRLENGERFELFDADDMPDVHGNGTTCEKGIKCAAGRSSFSIDWQGTMMPCNTFHTIAAKPLEIGFHDAWKYINHAVKEYQNPIECVGCRYEKICKNCAVEHANSMNDQHVNPRVCEFTKRMVKEGIIQLI